MLSVLNENQKSSSNDELLCKTKDNNTTQKTINFIQTHNTDTQTSSQFSNTTHLKKFNKVVIQPIQFASESSKRIRQNEEAKNFVQPTVENLKLSTTYKKPMFSLKRLRETETESSNDTNVAELHTQKSNNLSSESEKKLKKSDTTSHDEHKSKTKNVVISSQNADPNFSILDASSKPLAESSSQCDNDFSPPIQPSLLASKTKTILPSDVKSSVGLSNNKTVTGEYVQNKRVTQLIESPISSKRSKFSSDNTCDNLAIKNTPLALVEQSEKETNEKNLFEHEKLLESSSEENQIPKLNSVDQRKKLALENLSLLKKASNPVTTISTYKAREELEKKNSRKKIYSSKEYPKSKRQA